MISKKQFKLFYFLLFLLLSLIYFYQLSNQHWSAVIDMDLGIIYNSLLLNSGIEQEYVDHPAFTTFILNSFIYRIFNFFFNYSNNIDYILNSANTDKILQIYFYISRSVNFFLNIALVILFSKIIKSFQINRKLRFFICLIFIFSIGFLSSLFLLRSENISLLFLCLSIYTVLLGTKNLKFKFFISGMFLCLAMLAKIQIIFLSTYLIFLIPQISLKKDYDLNHNKLLNYYLILSLVVGFFFYLILQFYIQDQLFPQKNKYLDPFIFFIGLIVTFTYFYFNKNFKKNIIFFSSLMNGFVFLMIFILIMDQLGFLQVNKLILLRLSNSFHHMAKFQVHFADGAININYIFKTALIFFTNYKFNIIEFFLIIILFLINLRNKNYIFSILIIFIVNTLIMNFRYSVPTYHLYYIFIYLIFFVVATKNLSFNIASKLTYFALILFTINSFSFFVIKDHSYNIKRTFSREKAFLKICEEFKYATKSKNVESVKYIKDAHHKFDDFVIKKICNEIN